MSSSIFQRDVYLGKVGSGRSHGKVIAGLVTLSIVLIGSVVYFSFSRATIVVTPTTEPISVDFDAIVSDDGSLPSDNSIMVPGRLVQVDKSGSQQVKEVSVKEIPQRAGGTMTVVNNLGHAQVLVSRTRFLSSNGILFRSQKYISIPAKGTAQVQVVADEAGKQGNVGPGKFSIPGLSSYMQEYVYGRTDAAMAGGVVEQRVVTEGDINGAREELTNRLKSEAVDELKKSISDDEELLDGSFHAETVEFSSSANPGDDVESFSLEEKVTVTAVVFDIATLRDLAVDELRKQVPQGRELLSARDESFNISVSEVDFEAGTAKISAHLEGHTTLKLSSEIFNKSRLVGMNRDEVRGYFDQFDDVTNVEVHFSPFWQTSIPTLPDHINIEIKKNIE